MEEKFKQLLKLQVLFLKLHCDDKRMDTKKKNSKKGVKQIQLNLCGTATFVVYETDYSNYAGIQECQNLALLRRETAAILSRTSQLSASTANMAGCLSFLSI